MFRKIHRPSTATVIALLALFVALSGRRRRCGSACGALRPTTPKPPGKTVTQLLAVPEKKAVDSDTVDRMHASGGTSPATSAGGLVAIKTAPWTINPKSYSPATVTCDADLKAIMAAERPGGGAAYESYPTAAGDG
jgi:hypothetical protein